jgi:hypothetical protein
LWKRLLGDALAEQLEEAVRVRILDGMSSHALLFLWSRSDGAVHRHCRGYLSLSVLIVS